MTMHEKSRNLNQPNQLNQSAAINTAVPPPTTPRRPAPNSARKRRQVPDLSRPTATPGHGVKMSMIFRDAANSLQGSGLSPHQKSSNVKKSRLPLPQARGTKFGSTCQDATVISSSLSSPLKMKQHPGGPCDPMWASSEVSHHWSSRIGLRCPTPIRPTKAGTTTLGTITDQCFGAATDVDGMCLDESLRVSSVSPPSYIGEHGREPVSSGFATPIASTPNFVDNAEDVMYPILGNWRSLRSRSNASSFGSDNDDLHSTHGVPLILPFSYTNVEEAPRSDIDTWLNGVSEATFPVHSSSPKPSGDRGDLLINDNRFSQSIASNFLSPIRERVFPLNAKQDMHSLFPASSDKENISPSKHPPSPTRPAAQHLHGRTSSRFRQPNTQATLQPTKPVHFTHRSTPQGHLNAPSKRKRARIDGITSSGAGPEMSTARRDFTIHEDRLVGALAQLSPDVERYRKGRGPRRERCVSYWDEDILRPGSQCVPMDVDSDGETERKEKEVLGELKPVAE